MCGIVGMVGNISPLHQKMFRDMLLFDVVRGMDSTGVVSVPLQIKDKENPAIIEKDIGLPDELWRHHGQSQLFDSKGYLKGYQQAVIGHNRAATVGKVNVQGAHPFRFGNIMGVHNGTLRQYKDLDGYGQFDVDSMVMYNHIEKHGIADAWKNFLGAAALVWWDETDRSLNIIRNGERPLVYAYNKEDNVMFYASEEWMITAAAHRRGVKLRTEEITDKNGEKKEVIFLRKFTEHHHYKYQPTNTKYGFVSRELLEKKSPPPSNHTVVHYTNTYGASGKSTSATKPSFGGKSYEVGPAANKKQINAGWASSMERGEKETRGLRIQIHHEVDKGRQFVGRIVSAGTWKGEFITVYPNSVADLEQLRASLKKNCTTFKTHARLRFRHYGAYRKWGVSSAGIKPVITTPKSQAESKTVEVPAEDYEDEVIPFKDDLFRTFNGHYVGKEEWYRLLSPSNCACAWCNSPLNHEEHKETLFLSKNDALCPDCTVDDTVIEYVQGMFPGTSGVNYAH